MSSQSGSDQSQKNFEEKNSSGTSQKGQAKENDNVILSFVEVGGERIPVIKIYGWSDKIKEDLTKVIEDGIKGRLD